MGCSRSSAAWENPTMKKIVLMVFATTLLFSGLGWAGTDREVLVQELAKTTNSWDGQPLPTYPRGNPEVTILHITVPPDFKLAWHKHPVINAGYLLSGELTVVTENDETLQLSAGEAIVEVVEKWHYGHNTGGKPAEIVVFYAGVKDMPITITKSRP